MKKILIKIICIFIPVRSWRKKIKQYFLTNKLKDIGEPIISPTSSIDINTNIGDYTYIGKNNNITKASIGRYCSIANNCSIGMGEHNINKISTSTHFEENNIYNTLTKDDLTIGNDVWIAEGCIIRRGIKIGNGAVIGANSFVNKDVPEFAVVAGSPAKIIKYRFNKNKISKINKSKWWEKDLKDAKKIIKDL